MHRIAGLFLTVIFVTATAAEPVTVYNFARAESDRTIRYVYQQIGFGALHHDRMPPALDEQPVIRMNRDTLYSTGVLDLSKPATVIMPDADGRFMNLHVINQDHYSLAVTGPGEHALTEKAVGSRYAYLIIRTFVDPGDPADVASANKAQDGIKIKGGADGPLDVPDWDEDQLLVARQALNTLASLGTGTAGAFGTKDEVDSIEHLMLAAAGWGGLPQKTAIYQIASVRDNDGTPHAVTVTDVPVDAFWSVTVYNAEGYIEENELGVNSFNGVTAQHNDDGSVTLQFGGCDDGRVNCIPISEGWSYTVRMYEPHPEVLDGTWVFPAPEPIN